MQLTNRDKSDFAHWAEGKRLEKVCLECVFGS